MTLTFGSGESSGSTPALTNVLPASCSTISLNTDQLAKVAPLSGGSDNNYAFTLVGGTLTVTRAPLTVTAENKSRTYGAANPPLTLSFSGFVNGDNASVIDTLPTVPTSAPPVIACPPPVAVPCPGAVPACPATLAAFLAGGGPDSGSILSYQCADGARTGGACGGTISRTQ